MNPYESPTHCEAGEADWRGTLCVAVLLAALCLPVGPVALLYATIHPEPTTEDHVVFVALSLVWHIFLAVVAVSLGAIAQ